jgi:LuxR family maltose regulon positive regulatory protein
LLERLDEALRLGHKLTLVAAPAGFGKTTLVTEWIHARAECELPVSFSVAWLSLDQADNDPVRFLTHLVAALQKVDGQIGQSIRGLLRASQLPAADYLATGLVNDLAVCVGATPRRLVLVLDDYHVVRTAWIHQVLQFLIAHQPPQLHLLLTTRQTPPLPLSRLRVRGQVTELGVGDLRFTTQEAAAFLHQALGLPLAAETIAALESRTEGWIAGLQLAALSLQGQMAAAAEEFVRTFSGSHHHVIDYLVEEVLAQQPQEIREFLYQTALLERLTAPLCDAVTGRDDSVAVLRRLDQANLFLFPLDDRREWYRYHHLFAEVLRAGGDRERQAVLHQRAASWLASRGLFPEAIEHALAAEDVDQAAQLIVQAARDAFRAGSLVTLGEWLDALPDERVQADSVLATYKGFVLFMAGRHDAMNEYVTAAQNSLSPDAQPATRGRLQSLQAHLALGNGSIRQSIRLSREALASLGKEDAFFRSLTLNLLGQTHDWLGNVPAAAEAYRQAVQDGRKAGQQIGAAVAQINLGFALNELGRRREAIASCEQFVQESVAQVGEASPMAQAIDLVWSQLSYEADELDRALEQAERGLALCRQANIADGVLQAHYRLAQIYLARGDLAGMQQVIQAVRRYAGRIGRSFPHQAWFTALESEANLRRGDLAAVAQWAEDAQLRPDGRPHYWDETAYTTYTRLLLAQDRPREARTLLETRERLVRRHGRNRSLITICLQQALVEQALGHPAEAQARVAQALRLAAPEAYRRAFLDEGPSLAELLVLARSVAPDFVDELLESLAPEGIALNGPETLPDQSELVEPLTERELEILQLVAAGLSNPEIAEHLYLSLNTVKWHAKNVYGKLNVSNRVEASTRARELDLL